MNRKLPAGTLSKSIIPNSPNRRSPWALKRDSQVRNRMRRLVETTSLTDLRYRPLLASLARISILVEQGFETLKQRKSLLGDDGEICRSVDSVRRLLDSQVSMLRLAGLTPTAIAPPDGKEFEAVFDRIEKMKTVRGEVNGKAPDTDDAA
jgi:hypothetical protein